MNLEFIPIGSTLDANASLMSDPDLAEVISLTVTFFARAGYSPPWIGYVVMKDNVVVGTAAFKGRPMHGVVEIAYGTAPMFRSQGIGAMICSRLVSLALSTDPAVIITARTLRSESHSTRILKKNHFIKKGTVVDVEDGKVWEWEYQRGAAF